MATSGHKPTLKPPLASREGPVTDSRSWNVKTLERHFGRVHLKTYRAADQFIADLPPIHLHSKRLRNDSIHRWRSIPSARHAAKRPSKIGFSLS